MENRLCQTGPCEELFDVPPTLISLYTLLIPFTESYSQVVFGNTIQLSYLSNTKMTLVFTDQQL